MKIVDASYSIEQAPDPVELMLRLERTARTCYRSEISKGSADKLIKSCIDRGHESVIEHASISVRFVIDRGVSHELVRHRLASFSQESTRYVRYGAKEDVTFIRPCFWDVGSPEWEEWGMAMSFAEDRYLRLLRTGAKPEEARAVLPNSLRTEIVMTANVREWRHVLKLRTSKAAHPQMREVMCPLEAELSGRYPVLFGGL